MKSFCVGSVVGPCNFTHGNQSIQYDRVTAAEKRVKVVCLFVGYCDTDDVAVLGSRRDRDSDDVHGIEDFGVPWVDEIDNVAGGRASGEVVRGRRGDDFNEQPVDSVVHDGFLDVVDAGHDEFDANALVTGEEAGIEFREDDYEFVAEVDRCASFECEHHAERFLEERETRRIDDVRGTRKRNGSIRADSVQVVHKDIARKIQNLLTSIRFLLEHHTNKSCSRCRIQDVWNVETNHTARLNRSEILHSNRRVGHRP